MGSRPIEAGHRVIAPPIGGQRSNSQGTITTLPIELEEAARIDEASTVTIWNAPPRTAHLVAVTRSGETISRTSDGQRISVHIGGRDAAIIKLVPA